MPNLTLGDMAQNLILSRQGTSLKSALQALSTEITTGLTTNTTARVRGDYAPLAGIEATLTQLQAFRSVTTETAMLASIMQTALNGMSDHATTLGASLLAAATGNSPARIDTLGVDASQRLQSVMTALNTRLGERALFAGVATDHAATVDTETMMTALDAAVAGAISSADVEIAVTAWFDDPLGFAATVYQGGDPLAAVAIGPDEVARIDVTALDPAIVATLKGLAMAALLNRGTLAGSDVARADLAKRAGESLASSATARAQLSARLGTTEAGIANAAIRNDSEKSALETARLDLLSVDPYDTAARLEQTQSQLEALYTITARLSRLNLVDFLR
jgi:flagellar hook-associated protein 3 FlgL